MSPPDRLQVPPAHVTNGQLFIMMQAVSTKQSLQLAQHNELKARIEQLDIDTRDMREAWGTIVKLVRFLKYVTVLLAGMVAAYYAVANVFKEFKEWLSS